MENRVLAIPKPCKKENLDIEIRAGVELMGVVKLVYLAVMVSCKSYASGLPRSWESLGPL